MEDIKNDRPLCGTCKRRVAAVNYHKNGKVHYRSQCEFCIAPSKRKPIAGWQKAGYKLKEKCDQCGFKRKYPKQMTVWYIDGDLRNNNWSNLKSICANCAIEISIKGLPWKEDGITPDF